jgi:hypothetical protein
LTVRGELKFVQAQNHLGTLRGVVAAYQAQVADALVVVTTAQDGGIEYRRGDVPAPPAEIGLALGDFLQAARASLDHAVYAISTATAPTPIGTGFPLFLTESDYRTQAARHLRHVPEEVRRLVEQLQPFADGAGAADPLWQLHHLAVIDRHREITLLAAVVAALDVGWTRTDPSDDDPDIRFYVPAVAAGELLLRLPSPEQEPTARFDPNFELTVVIGEGDRRDVRPEVWGLATEIRGRVWTVLGQLERAAGPA